MNKLIHLSAFAGLLLVGCGGGGSGSGTEATPKEYDEVAQSVGSTAVASNNSGTGSNNNNGGDTGAMANAISISTGTTPLGYAVSATGHVTGSVGGISFDFTVSCKDASGASLGVCGATTDSASVDASWTGSLDLTAFMATLTHSSSWTIKGLTTATATVDGNGDFTYDSSFTGGLTSTYHLQFDADYHAVAIDTSTKHAIGGSIDYAVSAKHTVSTDGGTSERDLDIDATVTFHADQTATIVLDGSHNYTLDLTTGVVVSVSGS